MTASVETKVAHFVVYGEGLTRIARDFMLSEMPSSAWRFIAQGLRGDDGRGGESFAADVLDGKKKLIGNSSLKNIHPVIDRGSKRYQKELRYIYAGRVRIDKTWWRPRAKVVRFGPEDAHYAQRKMRDDVPTESEIMAAFYSGRTVSGVSPETMRKLVRERVRYYADEGERVIDIPTSAGFAGQARPLLIIFEPASERPFWWPELRSPAEALREFEALGRRLDEVGYEPEDFDQPTKVYTREIDTEEGRKASREAEMVREAEREIERQREFDAKIAAIREKVIAESKGDMLDLVLESGKTLSVPRAPFMNWALRRTSLRHLAPPWNPISPSGLKLALDDPNHTDWWLGAGLDLGANVYGGEVSKAADAKMFELHQRLGDFECAVLVEGAKSKGEVTGTVGEEIVVLHDLRPDHLEAVTKAEGVVTEAGGTLAHLATVALERGIPIMLLPDAVQKFPPGTKLTLSPREGKIRIHYRFK